MTIISANNLPVLYVDHNPEFDEFPTPGRVFYPSGCTSEDLFGVVPNHLKFSGSSLYVLNYNFGNIRKSFLMHMLHRIDAADTSNIPGWLIPSIVVLPLSGFTKTLDTDTSSKMVVPIADVPPSIQALEIDIKLFAEALRLKGETSDFISRKMAEIEPPSRAGKCKPTDLLSFTSPGSSLVDKKREESLYGPYYLVYSLAGLLIRDTGMWETFWQLSLEEAWQFLTSTIVSLSSSPENRAIWKEEGSQAPPRPSSEEPKARKKKEPPPVEVEPQELSPQETIKRLNLDEADKRKLLYEMKKLENSTGQERNNLLDWINQVTTFPWGKTTAHPIDFNVLRKEMDVTHYGLSEVKDSLLEHMIIETISNRKIGGVLCFTGPAGTGKTSIAQTLARVSGRKCFSLPLGGVTDEAEIRGHRRTYVSSKAGRIVNILQQADCIDPVIILDEIDKSPFKGTYSPVTSSLLEVLDPQQNSRFLDKYFEIPINLSKVMFICTSNDADSIPAALKDRMELIEFRDYTVEERRVILSKYIIPNVLKEYCIESYPIIIQDSAIEILIKEVRLRQIEMRLRSMLKKCATRIFLKEVNKIVIDDKFVLGTPNEQARKSPAKIGFK